MNRKLVYGLLALPLVLCLVLLAILPGETRATFFTEFKHRVGLMMGYEPETYTDGEMGLRSEHPEEYGYNAPSEDVLDEAGDGENGEGAADVESQATADASEADAPADASVDTDSSDSE